MRKYLDLNKFYSLEGIKHILLRQYKYILPDIFDNPNGLYIWGNNQGIIYIVHSIGNILISIGHNNHLNGNECNFPVCIKHT